VLRWAAADTAAAWKACTKKLSAISRQLSVGSKAPLARAGPFSIQTRTSTAPMHIIEEGRS